MNDAREDALGKREYCAAHGICYILQWCEGDPGVALWLEPMRIAG